MGKLLEDDSAASVQLQESKDLFLLPMDLVDELNEAVQMFGGSALVWQKLSFIYLKFFVMDHF